MRVRSPPRIVFVASIAILASLLFALGSIGDGSTNPSSRPINNARLRPTRSSMNIRSVREPKISIITSVYRADEWIVGFLNDTIRQTAFHQSELLLAMVGPQSSFVMHTIASYSEIWSNIYAIPMDDLPLYEVWNRLIRFHAKGTYITNANLDDRKRVDSLEQHMLFLDRNPVVALVCAGVRMSKVANADWEKTGNGPVWWRSDASFRLRLEHFFILDEHGRVEASQNLPHNNPMWRASLHDRIGYFDNQVSPYSDWELWLRAIARNEELWFLNETLGIYYWNENSYGRKGSVDHAFEAIRTRYEPLLPCRKLRVLVVHERLFKLNEGGDRRLWSLVKWLHAEDHDLTFVFRDKGPLGFDKWLTENGHQFILDSFNFTGLNDMLSNWHPNFDVAILPVWFWFTNPQKFTPSIPQVIAPVLREKSPRTKLVMVTDDIHHHRMSLKSDFMGEKSQIILQQVKEGEVSAYRAGDLVLTVSDEDAARVQQISHVSADVVEQLPFTEEIGEPSLVPFKDRTGVVFVGSGHNGNVEVVDSLIKDIMPLLCARIPNVTLHLVGSPKWIKMAQGKPCVHGTGEVDSVLPFLQTSRVFLNPMVNMGSGISTKSFLALAHGLPIVTTKHGLRGLCYKKRTCPGVSVGNDATTFAAEVEKLYTSEEIWQRASGDARKFAQENISVESVAKKESRLKGMLRSLGMAGCAKANSDGPSWLSRPNNWVGRL